MNNKNKALKSKLANVKKKADNRTDKRKIGDQGEEICCKFLARQGYSVIERNYLKKYGEIDIIAMKAGKYHFFEVKTVSSDVIHETFASLHDSYRPEENVHHSKIRRLRRVIQMYLSTKGIVDRDWQFNVATVYLNFSTRRARICLLENIVL